MLIAENAILEDGVQSDESWSPFARPSGEWYVLHTKSRQEKALSTDLASRNICQFLPLRRQTKYYGGRKAIVDLPLFAGYLFVKGDIEQVYFADRTRRVVNILKVADQTKMEQELSNLYLALGHTSTLDAYPFLKTGLRVEVRSGPFRGLQGLIESRLRMDRIILQVEALGRAVSLEVDASLLDLLD